MRFMLRVMLRAMFALTTMLVVFPAHAAAICTPGRDLLKIPEIKRQNNGLLRGVVTLSDEERSLAGSADGTTCDPERLRFFKGYSTQEPVEAWPSTGDPIPGPTLRARVGDLVELTFLNQVDPRNFPKSLDQGPDRGKEGTTEGCDSAKHQRKVPPGKPRESRQTYPRNDRYPNCLHGSSTANIHFHGTHTTPSTTGDNVLLFIRPALRQGGKIDPPDDFVMKQFSDFFQDCEKKGPPQYWTEMPTDWQSRQKLLLETYDKTAPYGGEVGKLPADMKLWPKNEAMLKKGLWPQYSIGAFPYCFRLPEHDPPKFQMGQAPGTHWYHAHKHGSTALNVGNGMTGTFVIEGAYDDRLRTFYRKTPEHKNWGLQEQVLVIQQLESELNLKKPTNENSPPPLSVNGRLNPVVTMKPNQVQLWRIVNGAARNFVQFDSFTQHGPRGQSVGWRQIAQDGVQFSYPNYQRFGAMNAKFNLAAANRADLLVRAPAQEAYYALQVVQSVSDLPSGTPTTLLTVRVKADDKTIAPPMDFIKDEKDFPTFPAFLADIPEPPVLPNPADNHRELYFNTNPFSGRDKVSKPLRPLDGRMPTHEINGKLFDDSKVDQTMTLNTIEEWTLFNQTTDIAHPFHIHINPFQIVEVFQPNSAAAQKSGNCYADPLKPATWKPCKEQKLEPPFVWWDVFSIPTGRQDFLATSCTKVADCRLPPDIQKYASCAKDPKDQKDKCAVTIPGYFKMRSRFADFTGQYVIHCHILAHEDRGMMQLVEVIPRGVTPTVVNPYEHH